VSNSSVMSDSSSVSRGGCPRKMWADSGSEFIVQSSWSNLLNGGFDPIVAKRSREIVLKEFKLNVVH
jgi:hypothetical protein